MTATPKSYLSEEKRDALLREGGMELVYLAESIRAGKAGDEDTAWAWMSLVELSAHSLMGLKMRTSAQFIRDMGLNTAKADHEYGPDWLNRPDL